jgi:hypothetical protein
VIAIAGWADLAGRSAADDAYAGKAELHFAGQRIEIVMAGAEENDELALVLCHGGMEFAYGLPRVGSQ